MGRRHQLPATSTAAAAAVKVHQAFHDANAAMIICMRDSPQIAAPEHAAGKSRPGWLHAPGVAATEHTPLCW